MKISRRNNQIRITKITERYQYQTFARAHNGQRFLAVVSKRPNSVATRFPHANFGGFYLHYVFVRHANPVNEITRADFVHRALQCKAGKCHPKKEKQHCKDKINPPRGGSRANLHTTQREQEQCQKQQSEREEKQRFPRDTLFLVYY